MNVIPQVDRKRMLDFICDGLSSEIKQAYEFNIRGKNDIIALVPKFPDLFLHKYVIFLPHTPTWTKDNFDENLTKARASNFLPLTIFYKDGVHFFSKMGFKANMKKNKTFQHLTSQERERTISIKDLEKKNLNQNSTLCYYQPETQNLEESIRLFKARPVFLDYSNSKKQQFTTNHYSSDFMIMMEVTNSLTSNFTLERNQNKVMLSSQ